MIIFLFLKNFLVPFLFVCFYLYYLLFSHTYFFFKCFSPINYSIKFTYFSWRLPSYIVFCYTAVMTVTKKFVFFPFTSSLIPSPLPHWQSLLAYVSLSSFSFLSMLLVSLPLFPSHVLSRSIPLASQ